MAKQSFQKNYKQCLAIKPNYLLAILNFANLKEEMNELNESIELFQKAEKLNLKFNNIYIFNKLCNLYQIIGNKKEAKKYADLIIDTNPKNPLGYVLGSKFVDHKIEKNYMAKMEELLEKQNLKDHEIVDLLLVWETLTKPLKIMKQHTIILKEETT